MGNFNSIKDSLKGVNIIEAGAGTGKTYNIQNLYARMIIEEGYKVDSILVVTFTEAATKELKDRIRKILIQIQQYYEYCSSYKNKKNYNNDDELEERIKLIADSSAADSILKKRRIDSALRNFDTAAIFTIHGFCNRMLTDYSFESNILFNLELETNPESIVQDIIEDFWRIENYSSDDILITALHIANSVTIETLKKFIQACIAQSNISLEPEINLGKKLKAFKQAFIRLKSTFKKEEIIDILSSEYLKQNQYSFKQVDAAADKVSAFFDGIITSGTFTALKKFTADSITDAVKKGKKELFSFPVNHPVFLTCKQLVALEEVVKDYKTLVRTKCKDYFFKEYAKRKQQLHIQTFDDLLNKVNTIVSQKNSKLKNATVAKFNAAMIDEFQDTDPVQYNIFKKLFIETGKPVFLVGDPKQAIYAFRGGDIFTYQKAKRENINAKIFSLTTNWRSSDNMINAVNDIFTPDNFSPLPFADEDIMFEKANSSKSKNNLHLNNKTDKKPLKILFSEGECNKTDLEKNCSKITAHTIYILLQGEEVTIKNKNDKMIPVRPKDIAILVSSHIQARMVKKSLSEYSIPTVIQATGSVFETDEAEEFEYILKAIANPGNANLVKGALLTNILGFSPTDITEMVNTELQNSLAYEDILENFRELNSLCINKSFIEMFNLFAEKFNVKNILLGQIDGERKYTNIIHISELLHELELDSKLGMTGLISWLSKQRNKNTREDKDEYEIRLETDSEAVKIMTVHKSKGLEFPIVFCPFLWKIYAIPYDINKVICKYHKEGKTVLNLNNDKDALGNYYDEQLQELIRVFYVAVTRAKYQCYLIWGKIKETKYSDPPTSSLDYIFKFNDTSKLIKGKIAIELKNSSLGFNSSEKITSKNIQCYSINPHNKPETYIPESVNENASLKFREFDTEKIDYTWKIASFSGLSPHDYEMKSGFADAKDYDESDNKKEPENESATEKNDKINIFNFQPGAKTGTCWHEIFENLDFTSDDEIIKATVNKTLQNYNLDIDKSEEVAAQKRKCVFMMTKNVLNTYLPSLNNTKLSDITHKNKLAEMEFNFSLTEGFRTNDISDTVFEFSKKFGIQHKITNWNDSFIKGYMTGFIDLLFRHNGKYYIIDWKSNKLEGTPESFEQSGLKKEIAKNYYFLQYLIYTVALDKYLSQTIPDYSYDKHFGGIFYIFLRGVDDNPRSTRGIFYDKPDKILINNLAKVLT